MIEELRNSQKHLKEKVKKLILESEHKKIKKSKAEENQGITKNAFEIFRKRNRSDGLYGRDEQI